MKIIDNIKRNAGLKALSKSLRTLQRNKFVHNLVTARKIAIVGLVNNNKDFDEINSLQKFLTEKNMQVEILLYYPGKEIPQQLLLRKGINIFNRNEVNWYGKPLIPFVDQFCRVEYDILIDLSLVEQFPIRWISSLSRSKFKVGSHSYVGNPYDLIINVDNKKEIPYLSEQIIHYLNILNNRFAQDKEDDTVN
ncbi:MAG: hypothetical protein HOO91_15280 [Bacteroidales bacterium]|nr:hypothetical protein [Bacteroidales bacterium]